MVQSDVQERLQGGLAHHRARRWEEAEAAYRAVLELEAGNVDAMHLLGVLLMERGRVKEGMEWLKLVVAARPGFAGGHQVLGDAWARMGKWGEAAECYRRALALEPGAVQAWNNLGNVLTENGALDEGMEAYRKALGLRPDYLLAWNNLGNALRTAGRIEESCGAYRRALESGVIAHSNLAYTMHFHPAATAREIYEEHARWNQRHAAGLEKGMLPHGNERSAERRVRVGYVSPDFSAHVVGRFLLPLVEGHDREGFEVFCYSNSRREDEVTGRLRAGAEHWREVAGMEDEALAELIRADGIDVLVDLTMHMAGNRLLVFARKPAPVQVTYLAYCSTTGLAAMDYRLSDGYLDPVGKDEGVYSEKTVRLRSYWCYEPLAGVPEVGELSAGKAGAGSVTFGCLNNFSKVSERALRMWGEMMGRVAGSRMLLSCVEGERREWVRGILKESGVEAGRVDFVGKVGLAEYFKLYGRVDVALDSFPYGGGTTSCDAMWMGVPVVTLAGEETAVSRAGVSVLSNAGFPEWIARSEGEFVAIACGLAEDLGRLAEIRGAMRERMRGSVLMDRAGFVQDVEGAMRQMWGAWCRA